jgi:undecaprenol kinase
VSLGFLFQLSATEWLVVVIVSGGVFAAELFNTAVEKAIDLVSPTYHPLAKQAKDLSAAGVLAVAATAALCGILIYGKHFLRILIHYL